MENILEKIQSLGSKYIWRCVGEYLITDYIVKGVPMMKRYAKLKEKMELLKTLPDSYYLEKVELARYKEFDDHYRSQGVVCKVYMKDNAEDMKKLRELIYCEVSHKGRRYTELLESQWKNLFRPCKSPIYLPPFEYECISGTKHNYIWKYFGTKTWKIIEI